MCLSCDNVTLPIIAIKCHPCDRIQVWIGELQLPAHAVPEGVRDQIIELKTTKYFEKANFSHFKEILGREKFNIHISYSSLHGILTTAGIKSPKTRRPAKRHPRRKRRAREGIMLQMDASH